MTRAQEIRKKFLINTVLKEYSEYGTPLYKLGKKYNCCPRVLKNYLKELDLIEDRVISNYHDPNLNYNFLKIETEDQAYWLGFIYADGCVINTNVKNRVKYELSIGLKESDYDHLVKFKDFMGSDKNIAYRKISKSYRISINSKILIENIINIGIIPNKTYNTQIECLLDSVPSEFYKDFVRGYFDGDGHIGDNSIAFSSYNTNNIIKILEKTQLSFGYKIYFKNKNTQTTGDLRLKLQDSVKFLKYMYDNSKTFLNRKNIQREYFCRLRGEIPKIITGQKR